MPPAPPRFADLDVKARHVPTETATVTRDATSDIIMLSIYQTKPVAAEQLSYSNCHEFLDTWLGPPPSATRGPSGHPKHAFRA